MAPLIRSVRTELVAMAAPQPKVLKVASMILFPIHPDKHLHDIAAGGIAHRTHAIRIGEFSDISRILKMFH